MAEAAALWSLLQKAADPVVADALKAAVDREEDHELNRINPLAFAASHQLDEQETIGTLVQAARLGLFDMSWSMRCPGCGGVLESGVSLKALNKDEYFCSLCTENHEPTLDRLIEVTFTVNPRVRRLAAHDPDSLPHVEYVRQVFWSSAAKLPSNFGDVMDKILLDLTELHPGEKATMSLSLPAGFVMIFDPVTHSTLFLDISGDVTNERRSIPVVFADSHTHHGSMSLRPGPARITFENKSGRRTLPALWRQCEELESLFHDQRPFLTGTRLLSNQTFRDLYRTGTIDPEQRFKITSLTILFTDLKGSTALYDRIGDLAAFDLVRNHFGELLTAVSEEGGAVIKTIGDAVMASFSSPDRAIRAAIRMREGMRKINHERGSDDLALNIGLHEGPCLAVVLDDRQDYFGLSVNIASRVQGLADPTAILATKPIVESSNFTRILDESGYRTTSRRTSLRGVSEALEIYEIRGPAQESAAA